MKRRVLPMFVGTICVLLSSFAVADETEELAVLREELKALRAEVTALRKERDELKRMIVSKPKEAEKRSEGALNGIQWEISALNNQGVAIGSTTFYAQDGLIIKDGVEIGSYTDAGTRARMDITKATGNRANGTYNLLRIKNEPPTYTGTFKNREGLEVRVLLKALID